MLLNCFFSFVSLRCKGSARSLRSKFLILDGAGFLPTPFRHFPNARFE
ncbi:hypothetical protein BFAG_03044 [Bacteroides fragilis 3_1_12]|uniref:Uncharacterized protein n=1 Tax=Bacteroides fragilis 3_1_12 TaxID=457424 RepID=A0ABN0BN17_BACFG|nr:hypothetical protein BFAG_03044 [Bacteroides fragilis 3_1_12]